MMTTEQAMKTFIARTKRAQSREGKKYIEYIPLEEAGLIADVLEKL